MIDLEQELDNFIVRHDDYNSALIIDRFLTKHLKQDFLQVVDNYVTEACSEVELDYDSAREDGYSEGYEQALQDIEELTA